MMGPSKETNEMTRLEWRDLGFFYDLIEEKNEWVIIGSRKGVVGFGKILIEYSNEESNNRISEHDHLGPYMYLTIMTWQEPIINKHGINGTLMDLKKLGELIISKTISNANEEFIIDKEYSRNNEFVLKIILKNETFDPASVDKQLLGA